MLTLEQEHIQHECHSATLLANPKCPKWEAISPVVRLERVVSWTVPALYIFKLFPQILIGAKEMRFPQLYDSNESYREQCRLSTFLNPFPKF